LFRSAPAAQQPTALICRNCPLCYPLLLHQLVLLIVRVALQVKYIKALPTNPDGTPAVELPSAAASAELKELGASLQDTQVSGWEQGVICGCQSLELAMYVTCVGSGVRLMGWLAGLRPNAGGKRQAHRVWVLVGGRIASGMIAARQSAWRWLHSSLRHYCGIVLPSPFAPCSLPL
jgi:hypothetical protein